MIRLTELPILAAAALVTLPIAGSPAGAEGMAGDDCIASIEPAAVLRQAEPVTLRAELSEPVGEVEVVTAPEDSGIEIVGIDAEAAVPTVVVDVSAAQAGSWSLAFASEAGVCYGSLEIEA